MVLKLINKLREHRIPFILKSHNVPDVFSFSDRLVLMRRGHKVTEKRISETSSDEAVRYMAGTLDDSRAAREMV